MADPVTLVILVAVGEAASPAATAMAQGAHDAFAGTVTEVRETPTVPTDADALPPKARRGPTPWRSSSGVMRITGTRRSAFICGRAIDGLSARSPSPPRTRRPSEAAPSASRSRRSSRKRRNPRRPVRPTPGQRRRPRKRPRKRPRRRRPPRPRKPPRRRKAPRPRKPRPRKRPRPRPRARKSPTPGSNRRCARGQTQTPRAASPRLASTPELCAIRGSESTSSRRAKRGSDGPQAAGGGAALEWFVLRMFSLSLGAMERAGTLDVAARPRRRW